MAWNQTTGPSKPVAKKNPNILRGLIAGIAVVAIGVAAFFLLSGDKVETKAKVEKKAGQIKEVTPAAAPKTAEEQLFAKVKTELNESVREYINKPLTGSVSKILGPAPLDPDDPDNAFRTALAQDLSALLIIEPGEHVPPILPFHFMFEDAEREECEKEGRNFSGDGGNTAFLESLKKWKVAVSEKDSEAKAVAKQKLLEAQIDILKNMDEGLTVNDTIRAAYEFRVKAAETRSNITEAIREIYEQEHDVESTKGLIAEMDKKLKAEGIKAIDPYDVFGDEGANGNVENDDAESVANEGEKKE